jgi:DnaJ-class molecular chaperone
MFRINSPTPFIKECPVCGGTGEIPKSNYEGTRITEIMSCWKCKGTGKILV